MELPQIKIKTPGTTNEYVRLLCINNAEHESQLTVGDPYEPLYQVAGMYLIICDDQKPRFLVFERFITEPLTVKDLIV